MRLLVVTQVVDSAHPVLGFFQEWLKEFAERVERVEVICLYEGTHSLPPNVRVHSLGKESFKEENTTIYSSVFRRCWYAWRFLKLIRELRESYDAVFVHMNVEYVIVGGLFWRAWKKRIALWYLHGTVSLRLRLAVMLADVVLTASPESMRVATQKKRVVGHGIDTELFRPNADTRAGTHVLSVGRLSPRKRHDLAIRAAALAKRPLRIVGDGRERARLEALANELNATVTFVGDLSQEAVVKEYQQAGYFIHTSETGSMDKVVLEALACNTPVITTSQVYKGFPLRIVESTPDAIAEALRTPGQEIQRAAYIRERYSLETLIPRILSSFS